MCCIIDVYQVFHSVGYLIFVPPLVQQQTCAHFLYIQKWNWKSYSLDHGLYKFPLSIWYASLQINVFFGVKPKWVYLNGVGFDGIYDSLDMKIKKRMNNNDTCKHKSKFLDALISINIVGHKIFYLFWIFKRSMSI